MKTVDTYPVSVLLHAGLLDQRVRNPYVDNTVTCRLTLMLESACSRGCSHSQHCTWPVWPLS